MYESIIATIVEMIKPMMLNKHKIMIGSDARVSITLISTISLLISLLLVGVKSESTVITASVATSVEQVILLFIFVTHKKARKKLMTILKYKRQSKIPVRNPRPSVSSETVL